MCPQMIFSEASVALETWLRKRVTKKFSHWKPPRRERCARACSTRRWRSARVLLAFIFICYFVEPRDLSRRLLSLDIHTAGGHLRRGRHAGHVPRFHPGAPALLHHGLPLRLSARACSATATRCWSTTATRTTSASSARSACASAPWESTSASRRSRSSAYIAPSASMPATRSWRGSESPA